MFDVRVYLDPPEELRRRWKLQRDCSTRGYTPGQVLAELDRREPDSEAFIRPQRDHADIVVAFQPSDVADQEHLDAKLTLRDSLTHPDLSGVLADCEQDGLVLTERPGAQELYVPGRISSDRATLNRAEQLEELIWWKMHFARTSAPTGTRRVHDRHRAAPLRLARARAAPDPLPRPDGETRRRRRGRITSRRRLPRQRV